MPIRIFRNARLAMRRIDNSCGWLATLPGGTHTAGCQNLRFYFYACVTAIKSPDICIWNSGSGSGEIPLVRRQSVIVPPFIGLLSQVRD